MRHNLPADVPKETGGAWIERIKANNWQVPPDVRRQAMAHQLQNADGRIGA
jgi:hypothetical protein